MTPKLRERDAGGSRALLGDLPDGPEIAAIRVKLSLGLSKSPEVA
jgi:hypothetical protein